MIEKLTHLMVHSGATWVLWLLFLLSFVSVAIAMERAWTLRGSRGNVRAMVPELRQRLKSGDYEQACQLLDHSRSVEARVVAAGLAEAALGADAAEAAMAAAIGLERARLEKRLLFLGTVGNNAPFVGLLGTVIGIVGAFEALGRPQAMAASMAASALAPERVMGSIAEALVATAVGLLVAIPAVAAFNYFQALVAAAIADAETLGNVLLSHLKAAPDGRVPRRTSDIAPRPDQPKSRRFPMPATAE
jgi:biopolymer transport protein ExbB